MKNKTLWVAFTILSQMFSWFVPFAVIAFQYGTFIMSNSVVVIVAIAAMLAIWLIMKQLKETAETGYGLWAKTARAIRFVFPLVVITALVLAINVSLGSFVPIILTFLIGNIIAQPLSVLGYYYGPAYVRDTGINKLIQDNNIQ